MESKSVLEICRIVMQADICLSQNRTRHICLINKASAQVSSFQDVALYFTTISSRASSFE